MRHQGWDGEWPGDHMRIQLPPGRLQSAIVAEWKQPTLSSREELACAHAMAKKTSKLKKNTFPTLLFLRLTNRVLLPRRGGSLEDGSTKLMRVNRQIGIELCLWCSSIAQFNPCLAVSSRKKLRLCR